MTRAHWWTQSTPIGAVVVVSGAGGLRRIWFENDRADTFDTASLVSDAVERRDRATARQLDEWFAGSRRAFSLAVDWPVDLPPLARTVLERLASDVPWGETVAYGELAEMAGRPRAARAVGRIMSGNVVPFVIPCHRVIAAGGRIGGYGGGRDALGLKRWLLEREGVRIRGQCPPARVVAIPSPA